jgi:hypothetical protein
MRRHVHARAGAARRRSVLSGRIAGSGHARLHCIGWRIITSSRAYLPCVTPTLSDSCTNAAPVVDRQAALAAPPSQWCVPSHHRMSSRAYKKDRRRADRSASRQRSHLSGVSFDLAGAFMPLGAAQRSLSQLAARMMQPLAPRPLPAPPPAPA